VALLLTRTSQAIRTKALKRMITSMDANRIDAFSTEMNEREAFKAVFDHVSTLAQLKPSQISGLEKARQNAAEFTAEAIRKLQHIQARQTKVMEGAA
jgi:chromosome partitioning protein